MKPIEEILRERFSVAIAEAFGPEAATDPVIKAGDPKFADYQANAAMALGKKLGQPPKEVAALILRHLEIADLCDPPTIAGPGFINLRLKKEWLAATLQNLAGQSRTDYRGAVEKTVQPQTVVIDYSGPNVAKQMHIGHLRSTIIGDTLARTLEFLGHEVVRQNHLGEFGTPFGMLIHHIREQGLAETPFTIADLDTWYKQVAERFTKDEDFAAKSRKTVVELQSGEPSAMAIWNKMRAETHKHYTQVYQLLNVTLTDDDERGESFYGSRLPLIVERIRNALEYGGEGATPSSKSGQQPKSWQKTDTDDMPSVDAAEVRAAMESGDAAQRTEEAGKPEVVTKAFVSQSDGALCVFLPGYKDREGNPFPLMLQKSDGGYPYAATDLAALYFRVQENKNKPEDQKPLKKDWHADRVINLTDARQSQHFAMVFDAFRAAHWDRRPHAAVASLEHVAFGSILGPDRKPYKTRKGKSVSLINFLEEAFDAALAEVKTKNPELTQEKQEKVAKAVGLAAIKYADLRNDLATDYIFSAEQMAAFEGNTGPYVQYAYTRVRSIFRKAGTSPQQVADAKLLLDTPEEISLAKILLRFPGVIESVARDLKPHYLCAYLYDLAQAYSVFYEACPVIKTPAPPVEVQRSRLLLCDLIARTLEIGLTKLLGIQTLEEM